jgi:hypothetical protein
MAALENPLEGNLVTIATIGAAALALPLLLPRLVPSLRAALLSGAKLIVEAEAEAEGGLIAKLAENAVNVLLQSLTAPGDDHQRRHRAREAVRRFEETARARSRRFAWDEEDAKQRYRRHISRFRHALDQARAQQSPQRRELLDDVAGLLTEDW